MPRSHCRPVYQLPQSYICCYRFTAAKLGLPPISNSPEVQQVSGTFYLRILSENFLNKNRWDISTESPNQLHIMCLLLFTSGGTIKDTKMAAQCNICLAPSETSSKSDVVLVAKLHILTRTVIVCNLPSN